MKEGTVSKRKPTIPDLLQGLALICGFLGGMLLLPGFGPAVTALGALTFVGWLSVLFWSLSIAFAVLSVVLAAGRSFEEALGNWMEREGYELEDIRSITGSAEEGEVTITFNDGRTIILRKTLLGWEVIEPEPPKEPEGSEDPQTSNQGSSSQSIGHRPPKGVFVV